MSSVTLLNSKVPYGYFGDVIIKYVRETVTNILNKDFDGPIVIDDSSILRVLQRVLDERLEPLSRMLTRVIMEIVDEVKTFELERTKNIRLEKFFGYTQKIYDVSSKSGPDTQTIKLSRQPATLRFYHTFGI